MIRYYLITLYTEGKEFSAILRLKFCYKVPVWEDLLAYAKEALISLNVKTPKNYELTIDSISVTEKVLFRKKGITMNVQL